MLQHRNIIVGFLGVLALCACSSQYNIDGNSSISGLDGQKMYLHMMTADGHNSMVCIDSCEVVHGTFNFGGVVDSVAMAELYMGDAPMMPVVLENGSLLVQMDNMMQSVSGGPLNDRLNAFLTKRNRCENELWDIDRRARMMVFEGKTAEQIVLVLDPIKNQVINTMKQLDTQFVKDNYSNVLGPGYFMRMCMNESGMPRIDQHIIEILADAPEAFLHNPAVEHFIHVAGLTPEAIHNQYVQRCPESCDSTTVAGKRAKKSQKK